MNLQKVKPSLQVAAEDLHLLEVFRTHQDAILRLSDMEAMHLTRGRLAPTLPTCARRRRSTFAFCTRKKSITPPSACGSKKKGRISRSSSPRSRRSLGIRISVARAPKEIVEGAEKRRKELQEHLRKVSESLERLARQHGRLSPFQIYQLTNPRPLVRFRGVARDGTARD